MKHKENFTGRRIIHKTFPTRLDALMFLQNLEKSKCIVYRSEIYPRLDMEQMLAKDDWRVDLMVVIRRLSFSERSKIISEKNRDILLALAKTDTKETCGCKICEKSKESMEQLEL